MTDQALTCAMALINSLSCLQHIGVYMADTPALGFCLLFNLSSEGEQAEVCLLTLQLLLYPTHHRHLCLYAAANTSRLLVPQSLLIQRRDKKTRKTNCMIPSNTAEYWVLSFPLSLELTFMAVITFPSFKPQTFTLKKIRD